MARVKTEKELAKAIDSGEDTIEIEGDLAKKTIKIRATGKAAWIIAFGAISVALVALLAAPETAGTSVVVSGFSAAGAVGILGLGTTTSAIAIAVASGGVAVLTKMRNYVEISQGDGILVLKRR